MGRRKSRTDEMKSAFRCLLWAVLAVGAACLGPGNAPPPIPFLPDAGKACEHDPIDASASCAKPCDTGNERSVGEFCSKGGGECEDNAGTIICTVDWDDTTHTFCTRPCEEDVQCGSDARCTGDPADPNSQKGCVPTKCL
jgi:hypothetical protein